MAIFSSSSPTSPTSPLKPRFPSPQSRPSHHSRRFSGSQRRSSTSSSTIPAFPNAESPRTLCPRDHVAFAYDPTHLREWYMPQELWDKLPRNLHASIAAVQHAGAAVLTGFDRLEEAHHEVIEEAEEDEGDSIMNVLCSPINIGTPLQQHEQDHNDNANTFTPSTLFSPSAIDPSQKASVHTRNDSIFSISSSPTPSMCPTRPISPSISPLELPSTPILSTRINSPFTPNTTTTSSRTFTTPSSPKASYYLAELSHLRCEAIPRLRHAALRVDADHNELRRVVGLLEEQGEDVEDKDFLDTFEAWWKEKRTYVNEKVERVRSLVVYAGALGNPVLGWSGA